MAAVFLPLPGVARLRVRADAVALLPVSLALARPPAPLKHLCTGWHFTAVEGGVRAVGGISRQGVEAPEFQPPPIRRALYARLMLVK